MKGETYMHNTFEEISNAEMMEIDGGVAPFVIYGGALLGGWALGHLIGYLAG